MANITVSTRNHGSGDVGRIYVAYPRPLQSPSFALAGKAARTAFWRYKELREVLAVSAQPITALQFQTIAVVGRLQGQVRDGLTPVPYAYIRVYLRANGLLIMGQRCDVNGNFEITGLEEGVSDYMILAMHPDYNVHVYDRVVPLP